MRRPALMLLLLALCAVALPACGGGRLSTAEYEKQMKSIASQLQTGNLGDQVQAAKTPQQAGGKIEQIAKRLNKSAGELRDIDPPKKAADPHEKLTESVAGLSTEFDQLAKATKDDDQKKAQKLAQGLPSSKSVKGLRQSVADIKAAGFDIGN